MADHLEQALEELVLRAMRKLHEELGRASRGDVAERLHAAVAALPPPDQHALLLHLRRFAWEKPKTAADEITQILIAMTAPCGDSLHPLDACFREWNRARLRVGDALEAAVSDLPVAEQQALLHRLHVFGIPPWNEDGGLAPEIRKILMALSFPMEGCTDDDEG